MDEIVTGRRRLPVVIATPCVLLALAATASAQAVPPLGGAETFAVLSGSDLTNVGTSAILGDAGVAPGNTIAGLTAAMLTEGSLQEGTAVAAQALTAADAAYADLASRSCAGGTTIPNALGGQSLAPGLYCVSGDATLAGTLTLTGAGPWIFKISGTLVTSASSIVDTPAAAPACDGSNVVWQVGGGATPDAGEATLGATSTFVGTLLARTNVAAAAGVTVDGRLVALDGTLDLATATVSGCTGGTLLPAHTAIKVTGGGQIRVPSPDDTDPSATGSGRANYGFEAIPGVAPAPATGNLNYLNHVTRLHVRGTVTDVDVLTVDAEGLPNEVRFSGTCTEGADCTFSVIVDDNGEPARDDVFGVTVVAGGATIEERAPRVVENGNIQTHLTMTTELDAPRYRSGQRMGVSVSMFEGATQSGPVDAYLVLQLPNGQMLSWTGNGLVPGLVPVARNVRPQRFRGKLAELEIPPGVPVGPYRWLSALAQPGTLNLVSPIAERRFSIAP